MMQCWWKGGVTTCSYMFTAEKTGKEYDCVFIRFTTDFVTMPVGTSM